MNFATNQTSNKVKLKKLCIFGENLGKIWIFYRTGFGEYVPGFGEYVSSFGEYVASFGEYVVGYDRNQNLQALTRNLPGIRYLVPVLGLPILRLPGIGFSSWLAAFRPITSWLNQEDKAFYSWFGSWFRFLVAYFWTSWYPFRLLVWQFCNFLVPVSVPGWVVSVVL